MAVGAIRPEYFAKASLQSPPLLQSCHQSEKVDVHQTGSRNSLQQSESLPGHNCRSAKASWKVIDKLCCRRLVAPIGSSCKRVTNRSSNRLGLPGSSWLPTRDRVSYREISQNQDTAPKGERHAGGSVLLPCNLRAIPSLDHLHLFGWELVSLPSLSARCEIGGRHQA